MLDGQQARLTQAALETLAVVAYKQPVSRARVSAIRGVNVDGVMRTLLTRGLVEEAGHDGETGATLYRTTTLLPGADRRDARSTSCPSWRRSCPTWTTSDDLDEQLGRGPSTTTARADDRRRGLIRLQKLLAAVRGRQPPQVRGADARRAGSRSTARWSPVRAPRSTRRPR